MLKFCYIGWKFEGYVIQDDTLDTVEDTLFEALLNTRLIRDRTESNYHRWEFFFFKFFFQVFFFNFLFLSFFIFLEVQTVFVNTKLIRDRQESNYHRWEDFFFKLFCFSFFFFFFKYRLYLSTPGLLGTGRNPAIVGEKFFFLSPSISFFFIKWRTRSLGRYSGRGSSGIGRSPTIIGGKFFFLQVFLFFWEVQTVLVNTRLIRDRQESNYHRWEDFFFQVFFFFEKYRLYLSTPSLSGIGRNPTIIGE